MHRLNSHSCVIVARAMARSNGAFAAHTQAELMWHCDDSFRDPQPLGSVFFCVEAPDEGAVRAYTSRAFMHGGRFSCFVFASKCGFEFTETS